MFVQAHQTLHGLLQRYTFSVVARDVVIPDKAKEVTAEHGLRVTYYHGTAEERIVSLNYRERPKSVWFNKSGRAKDLKIAGVVTLCAGPPHALPNVTDMLVGIAETSAPEPGKPKRSGMHYTMWEMGATPVYELAKAVVSKVPLSEATLKPKLRLAGSEGQDELWALARLVLFGNVAAFDPQSQFPMALRRPPALFVQECAMRLNDDSIWQKYVEVCPAVKMALAPPPPSPIVHAQPPPELHMAALNDLLSTLAAAAPPMQIEAPPAMQIEAPPPPLLTVEEQVQQFQYMSAQPHSPRYAPHSPDYVPEFM